MRLHLGTCRLGMPDSRDAGQCQELFWEGARTIQDPQRLTSQGLAFTQVTSDPGTCSQPVSLIQTACLWGLVLINARARPTTGAVTLVCRSSLPNRLALGENLSLIEAEIS